MKTLYILFIGLLVSGGVMAQSCLPYGIEFTTQSQVDSFQILYPNCTEIEGDVVIIGDDITNLNGLIVLTSVGGNLTINENPVLSSLTGLDNVTSVGGTLEVSSNDALTSLTGLGNVTYVYLISIGSNPALTNLTGWDNLTSIVSLHIWNNNALTSLTGLDGFTFIGDLFINENDALTSLIGLDNLTSIGSGNATYQAGLTINGNNGLTSLTGLDNITSINGMLFIRENGALTNLTGLDNLTSIYSMLYIGENGALTNLTGLNNLTSSGRNLWIMENVALTSLTGLDNIDAASIDDLRIYYNYSLSTCEVQSVCDYLSSHSGTIEIHDNATGCNSQEEVEEACVDGLDENGNYENHLIIYPNPTSTQITIETPATPNKNTTLTICNLNGQELITRLITEQQTSVDVSLMPRGVYFVKVMDDENVMMGKVIKQ